MMRNGLLDEFRSLVRRGYGEGAPGLQAVGYREFFAFEKGEKTLEETVAAIKQDTRNYAKRQGTWFRHQVQGREARSDGSACDDVERLIAQFLRS